MTRNFRNCPFVDNPAFMAPDAHEEAIAEAARAGELRMPAGQTVVMEGNEPQRFFTLIEGQAMRYRMLEDGRRQVLNFLFPGDLIGLDAIMMGMASHTTEALTPVKLSVFDRKQVWELFSKMPQRAMMLTWQVAREEHFLSDALVTVGQRSAREALAWAFVTLFERGSQTGLVRDGKMPFPVRQQDLADALGLSLVHTNKTLARLRSEGLVRWAQGILELPDLERLADIGVVELGAGPPRYYL
ncbi:MAG: Crp/Fnr family transcriptional regulator [Thioclava sp.]|mgnify:CR=1 FL=1|nr:Crp/Fnr family transcriptional regulator [Thioclava sp.]